MMARLFDTAAGLLVYFLAATLVAELIVAGYVWWAWRVDVPRLAHVVAVAQGVEVPAVAAGDEAAAEKVPPEEVSYEAIVDRRARLFRDLELRELAMDNAVAQLDAQQQHLSERQQQQKRLTQQFESHLKTLKEGAEAEGREVVRATLQSLSPSQAKEQLFEMLDAGELDEVVMLLAEMQSSNRAKILSEFKTPEEAERLAEILKRILQGAPEASLADQAMNQLDKLQSALR